jgi:hypothetical protein
MKTQETFYEKSTDNSYSVQYFQTETREPMTQEQWYEIQDILDIFTSSLSKDKKIELTISQKINSNGQKET